MEHAKPKARRCAIYTRKSSEEGLEQDFNSLHAQREACEAFIKSQAGEGWRLVKTAYDDGGFSGGTMERPALQRLLADIGEGLIDVVVVYKVDRLTRSLADFAKMVELFDAQRRVVRRGHPAVQHHHLDGPADAQRAAVVRAVRARGHRRAHPRQDRGLQAQGHVDGRRAAARLRRARAAAGRQSGRSRDRQAHLSSATWNWAASGCSARNSTSVGSCRRSASRRRASSRAGSRSRAARYTNCWPIRFTSARSATSRSAIRGSTKRFCRRELWEKVQQRLNGNAARGRGTANRSIASPLAGKLFDADGQPLYVQGATKGRRRYRYYVSKCLVNGSASDNGKGWRLAAPEIERAVAIAARHILSDRAGLLEALEKSGIDSPDVRATLESASNLLRRLQIEADGAACLAEVIERVELRDDGISVTLRIQVPCSRAGVRTSSILNLSRFVPLRMKRRGVETRIIIAAGDDLPRKVDPALLKAVARVEGVV